MTQSEYLDLIDATLSRIEDVAETASADIEASRSGNVLTLEFESGAKIIINSQPSQQELWMAAREGGFHYRFVDGAWRDTRDKREFFDLLSELASHHAGEATHFSA